VAVNSHGLRHKRYKQHPLKITQIVGAKLQLEVRQAPLAQVLKEIAKQTGVRIHYSVLPEAPVTATCVGANVKQIMNCLVGAQLGLVAQSAEQGSPDEFWVLGSSVGSCQAMTIESATLPRQQVSNQQPARTAEEQARIDQALQELSDQLVEQTKAKTPELRAEAITNLISGGVKDDPNVRKALENALADKDPDVRGRAIAALAKREGEGASEELRHALQDTDVSVRMIAIESAGNDSVLLQQALNDKDPMIREYATSKLGALNKTARGN
jgi:hypothetical protein